MKTSLQKVFFSQVFIFSLLPVCVGIGIDSQECICKVMALQNQSCINNPIPSVLVANLPTCIEACGASWYYYDFWDIQKRIAAWVIPLIVIIGLAQFGPFRRRNKVAVLLHLLADPISSVGHLLWKLQNTRDYYTGFQANIPADIRRSATTILSAYEEWENVWYAERTDAISPPTSRRKERVAEFIEWLQFDEKTRREACLRAADKLAAWRASSLWTAFIGILNYVVAISLAFIKVASGEFNNRTGHSIAFGMLHSWLIPAVFMTSLVGAYHTKSATRRVFVEMLKETGTIAYRHQIHTSDLKLLRFPEHIQRDTFDYRLLEWCGGNHSFSSRQFSHGTKRAFLSIFAAVPFVLCTVGAVLISYSTPTNGIGCRTVHQLSFLASWILSALLTWVFGHITRSSYSHWRLTLFKDTMIFIPQAVSFCGAFVGWYNSCYCWSAAISLHDKAYVVLNPITQIRTVSMQQWAIIAGVVLALHFFFIALVWGYYAPVVHLHKEQDIDDDSQM